MSKSCDLINAPASARSLWAEKMAVNFKLDRCSVHNLFHHWVEMSPEEKRDAAGKRYGVRFDIFHEVSPGKYVLRDVKPAKKGKGRPMDDMD